MITKYFMPTQVCMGTDCVVSQYERFTKIGTKALIVTGRSSAKINGSLKDVLEALNLSGIGYVIFDQVMTNPTVECVYLGAEIAKKEKVDFIIAIGGGSPIDAAKGMALVVAQDLPKEKLFSGMYNDEVLPLVAIPTTAGTGSEVTQYSILTNIEAETKTSIATDLIFPVLAFLDPKYMMNLNTTTTINTGIDALSHAVEGMLSVRATMISDALARESIAMIMKCLPKLKEAKMETENSELPLKVREKLLHASFLAGMVIAQTGTTAVHAMGYSLTYFKDIDHGRANGLLLGQYLKLVEKKSPELVEQILKAMNLLSIEEFQKVMDDLLGDKEILTVKEIESYSTMAIQTKNIGNSKVQPKEEDIIEMYSVIFCQD